MANPKKSGTDAHDGKGDTPENTKVDPQDLVEMNDPSLSGQQSVAMALQAGKSPVPEQPDE